MLEIPRVGPGIDVGVFGGSGFYRFLDDLTPVEVETPFGPPAEPPVVGEVGGRRVAFLPRHGNDHRLPAHRVNYRANVWALAALGAHTLISPFACGSLRPDLAPSHLVIVDQFVDRTSGREGTFFDGPSVWHQPVADPYDAAGGEVVAAVAEQQGLVVHRGGTVVVVAGPRFSTRAESDWHRSMGWDLVNMTQAPEVALAIEAGLRVVGIGLVTDYDVGLDDDPSVEPVTQEEVFAVIEANAAHVRDVLRGAIPRLPS